MYHPPGSRILVLDLNLRTNPKDQFFGVLVRNLGSVDVRDVLGGYLSSPLYILWFRVFDALRTRVEVFLCKSNATE